MISPKDAVDLVKHNASYLAHNGVLINILEGCLLPYIDADLKADMSPQSYEQAKSRIVPINMLPKIIDKLTNIYQTGVVREVVDGTDADKELLAWYEQKLDINNVLNCANEMLNTCKAQLIQPYLYGNQPSLRVVLNDKFVPYSSDEIRPDRPTDIVILAGKEGTKDIYHVYGEYSFYIVDSDNTVRFDLMAALLNESGVNPVGRLPFTYAADSKYRLQPVQDTDMLKMIKVIPIMLTDLNFAAKFQCFSIIYGINLDDEGIVMAPNAVWKFKTDREDIHKPELGTIKPTVDYDQALKLIESELSMWLGTKGIRPGAIGQLTAENVASGISKIIDEMDTFEARQKQVSTYMKIEEDLWDLILNHLHPYWVEQGLIDNRQLWSGAKARVKTTFAVQLPTQSRGTVVRDLRDEYAAGFITRAGAIMKLNPQMTHEQVEELMREIDEERGLNVQEAEVVEPKALVEGSDGSAED